MYDRKMLFRTTIAMAWPAMLESFFVAFIGMVDSYMVSSLGSEAVASVGLTQQPKMVGLALFMAINVSLSALVARRKGEQRRREANEILVTALFLIVISAIVVGALMSIFASPIIHLSGSKPETHDRAVAYFRIIMSCMVFNCIQMGVNAAQRGAGNTRITMRTNITANLVNVCANYLLINGHFGFPALGVQGAAIATVLGTVVASVMSVLSIMKSDVFVSIPYVIKEKIRASKAALVSVVRVGYSVFFEQLLMRVGFMLTSMMAARQGTNPFAAHNVSMNVMGLSFSFGDGLQATAVALIGRSLGQKEPELAKAYGGMCRRIGFAISLFLSALYFFGARIFMQMFFPTSPDFPQNPEIVEYGVSILRLLIFIVIFQVSQVIYMGCLRGAGDTAYTAMASTISVSIIRTVFAYLGAYVLGFGIVGVWFGVLADQVSRFLFGWLRFRSGKWTKIKI